MKNILLIILCSILVIACTKNEVNVVSTIQLPVVESYLIAGGPISVKLSLPVAVNQDATNPTYLDGLTVIVYEKMFQLLYMVSVMVFIRILLKL